VQLTKSFWTVYGYAGVNYTGFYAHLHHCVISYHYSEYQ